MITFSTISGNKRVPTSHYEFDASKALQFQSAGRRALVTGIKLSTGATAELIPKQLFGETDGDTHFGVGSQIAEMARAFKKLNPDVELWGIGIDELSSGTAGTITLTAAGTSTAAGVFYVEIDGRHVECSIPSGTAAAAAGPLLDAAIKAHSEYARMQYTSAAVGAIVTLTRKWKGIATALPIANYNPTESLPAGLTLAIAAGTAGAGNPDAAEIITVMGDEQYDHIAWPFTDATNLGLIESEMVSRFGGERQIDGLLFAAGSGSLGTLTTLGNSRNSPHLSVMDAGLSPHATWIWAAECAALASKAYLNPSAGITGAAFRMNVKPSVKASQRTRTEQNGLLYDGVSTHKVDSGGNVYIQRLITTYQTNSNAIVDASYLKVETMHQISNIRKSRRDFVETKYEGWMKADSSDDLPPGLPVATPEIIKGDALGQFRVWRGLGLVQGSEDAFLAGYIIETDTTDTNRYREQMTPYLMQQMFGISGKISFLLQPLFN